MDKPCTVLVHGVSRRSILHFAFRGKHKHSRSIAIAIVEVKFKRSMEDVLYLYS